jgi:hypothetical protein
MASERASGLARTVASPAFGNVVPLRQYSAAGSGALSEEMQTGEIHAPPPIDLPKESARVMADMSRDEIKAEIALAEARTDTKIARMEGKLDLVLSKLDGVRDDYRNTRSNQWVIGLGLAVLIIGMVALFPVFFSIGAQVRDLVHTEIQSQSGPKVPPNIR